MTAEAKKECDRELKRLSKMTSASAEYMVSRTYLEWMTSCPGPSLPAARKSTS